MPYIANNFDFQDLLSEMLGELNGSHTGARYSQRSKFTMGWLGAIYDYDYEGDGLKIAEVLPGGALNLADSEIKAGDIIESIDGQPIKAGESWFGLLRNKAGKKVAIVVKKGKKDVELFIEPGYSESSLMYRRWVKQREEMTDKMSGRYIQNCSASTGRLTRLWLTQGTTAADGCTTTSRPSSAARNI